jgi:hypothetical protein
MERRIMRVIRVLVSSLLLLSCTTPVPPTITSATAVVFSEEPTIFLMAARKGPRVAKSLRDAGFTVLGEPSRGVYGLRVDVGTGRGGNACGSVNNVRYVLLQRGAPLMELKGRGRTGACTPNVFDDMSRLLASHFSTLQGED